ncbi:CBS domain-containing protein [Novosphingobium mangrovi (ex Huang et al. 2023)]|uniref:CBS domain-containing protein n=1 Tax=Novosphingobium mangrovi (ex Huang et al. 2023) TaxID=2976432 RepID=A0ABT2I8Z1_9SPHN|nr:CBS domain-containing protein [Novosphingobium mangrovi (ex Huang et al. 2023)]MCT2401289.1 CBS domain-containing protein [Novosphingobium mangrovi (ex Huang et al. 2023)]
MTIGRLIEGRDAVLTCDVTTTVREAVSILAGRRIGALPVLENESIAGMFSERDVIYRLHESGPDILERPVSAIMTAPAVTVEPETSVMTALALMTRRRIRHLPVVEGGRMIGLVSIGDLVKHRIDAVESEAAAMRDYIQMA